MAMACEQLDWWRIVTLAREYGESVSSVHAGEERLTALHHAVLDDKPEYAYQLAVQYGAPTNAIDVYGDTPLISAVQNCRYTIVHMLVRDAKADVTIIGRFGLTALREYRFFAFILFSIYIYIYIYLDTYHFVMAACGASFPSKVLPYVSQLNMLER